MIRRIRAENQTRPVRDGGEAARRASLLTRAVITYFATYWVGSSADALLDQLAAPVQAAADRHMLDFDLGLFLGLAAAENAEALDAYLEGHRTLLIRVDGESRHDPGVAAARGALRWFVLLVFDRHCLGWFQTEHVDRVVHQTLRALRARSLFAPGGYERHPAVVQEFLDLAGLDAPANDLPDLCVAPAPCRPLHL